MKKDILKNKIIFKKYKTISRIGKGSFGYVYSAKNINDNTKVAVKFEEKTCKNHLLEKESNFLSILKGIGIPQIFSYGYNNNYYILIQELLGENLFQLISLAKLIKQPIEDIRQNCDIKYKKFDPVIDFEDETIQISKDKIANISNDFEQKLPTQEEIENAQKYNDKVFDFF